MSFDIGSVIAKVDADVSGFKAGMQQVNQTDEQTKSKIATFGDTMGRFGKTLSRH